MGVTGTGKDNNGTTADVCIRVPSENCVVRGSMYVEPMGRNVIFYLYPDSYTVGNSTDMTPAMVTEASAADMQSETYEPAEETTVTEPEQQEVSAETAAPTLQSSITTAAAPQSSTVSTDGTLSSAQGLSLSTEDAEARAAAESGDVQDSGTQIVVLTTAITISGMILMAVTAMVIYYFRKNWRRWGGYDDED